MKTAGQIMSDKGYEPSKLDTGALMLEIEKFYKTHNCNDRMIITDVYLGNFDGEVRKRGFVVDVENPDSEKLSKFFDRRNSLWYELGMPKDSSELIKLLIEEYGEEFVCASSLYDSQLIRKRFDLAIDKQYVTNAIAFIKMKEFVVKKKTVKGVATWMVSLMPINN